MSLNISESHDSGSEIESIDNVEENEILCPLCLV